MAEQTLGPLLIWAMRVVDELSDDILAAWTERQRLVTAAHANPAGPEGRVALRAYLEPLIANHAPIPANKNQGPPGIAAAYIGGLTGANAKQVINFVHRHRLTSMVAQRPGPCPLDLPVTGRIAGQPWRQALDFNDAPALIRHLGTAAFIVCAYLTGMRPQEKRAELHWMQHSSRLNTGKPTGQTATSDQLAS